MALTNYWLSWVHRPEMGGFELHWPWWISGTGGGGESVCAAVQASSADEATDLVFNSYDDRDHISVDWRFCEERPDDWTPYGDRFERADWMPDWPSPPTGVPA